MRIARTRILVIDHHVDVAQLLHDIFEDEGFSVQAVSDLDAAVHVLTSAPFDLVVCNYMESNYHLDDCWPILEMFKAFVKSRTPIIVLTSSSVAINQGAKALGVAAVIEKPFDVAELLTSARRLLRNH